MQRFAQVSENQITQAILNDFQDNFKEYLNSEVIIVGAGPSGLVAARELAREGVKVLVIESNNYLGGGFWLGGFLMNTLTFRASAQEALDEIGIPYKEVKTGLFISSGPYACSKLILSACEAGARFLNMVKFDDVVLREGNRLGGVVINWTPVSALPRQITCVDPIALEARIVVDASGHDAAVAKSLAKRGLLEIKGFSGMQVEESEHLVVNHTQEIYPGLVVCGMSVAEVFGLPRMGPTFAGMLLSGKKAANIIKDILVKETVAI